MDYKCLVEMAILAGEIMLAGGAETYRVEDTMMRILKVSGLKYADTCVTGTGINITLSDDTIDTISYTRRVGERVTNLGKIYQVNSISRKFCNGEMTEQEAYQKLLQIKQAAGYPDFYIFLGNVGTVMFFTLLLGGNKEDFIIASMNGVIVALLLHFMGKVKINAFITNVVVAAVVAVISNLIQKKIGMNIQLDLVISGSILPLLPGVAITNAIRDTLQGDYMSGGARIIEAFVIASSIAVGIGLGLTIFA